jgi:dTDP-glucose pyrophosphorylase
MCDELIIHPEESVRKALSQLNATAQKLLMVCDKGKILKGVLSDGDIRRALLEGITLDSSIEKVYNRHPVTVEEGAYSNDEVKKTFLERRIDIVPVVDAEGKIAAVLRWEDWLNIKRPSSKAYQALDVPVVIMAGGKGSRMAPFTTILPKPLIPIGEKSILELIIDNFRLFGIKDFYFTINYRGEMIKAYFDGLEKDYSITYIKEEKYLGTAGSLAYIKSKAPDTFIVSNCDIIVKADFAEVMEFHRKSGSLLTFISSMQHHQIPYGVVDFKAGGEVIGIREKPEFTFPINTGVYILEAKCLDYIPEGEVFHMTNLIDALMADGKKVSTYPINEKEYIDIGQWEEYRKAVTMLQ